ncbi:MAG: Gfo/Idh/MocA family oxidoreductase [Leptolyngbya sp. SIO1D8]|nr:Gfo/Idh/MocA family oxidoreductase [Leptolyngbya sp. SIO1D8]
MNIAIVGCGFVADYYLKTLQNYPSLNLLGITDRLPERIQNSSVYHKAPIYKSLQEILEDPQVDIVLNLTNPSSHFEVSKACLEAGKHVYSEKPLSINFDEAKTLVNLAKSLGLQIVSAPCNLLSETAQTLWKALRENVIGQVRLVYAEMDDGMVHKMPYKKWKSESGISWPYKDEFEVGCTLEHAGYYVSWLAAFFGPAKSITAFSSCLISDKETDIPLDVHSPDFSVACIQFQSGVVARLTCGIVAPHDHQLTIVGDKGLLCTQDCWYYRSPVYSRRRITLRRKTFISPWRKRYPLVNPGKAQFGSRGAQQMDFCRGVFELAQAIQEQHICRLSPQFSLHVNEIVLAIQNALVDSKTYYLQTEFDPIPPMPWAC